VEIVVDDLTGPQIASFLDEHVREMLSITPPESKHALDLETLRGPGITFWSVMDGGTVVGCGALKRLDARHAEVKSMRTLEFRGPDKAFGVEVPVADDAPVYDRLAGWFGRDPGWERVTE
jgi:hypothetical protein